MKTFLKSLPPGRIKLARSFRKRATDPESRLWMHLRNRGLGVKFRRQVPLGPYIVDFLSLEAGLIIEVDGSQHGELGSRIKDQKRDQFLRSEGYEIVRIWDRDIQQHLEGCLQYLGEKIAGREKIE